jgi:hypothetical protein
MRDGGVVQEQDFSGRQCRIGQTLLAGLTALLTLFLAGALHPGHEHLGAQDQAVCATAPLCGGAIDVLTRESRFDGASKGEPHQAPAHKGEFPAVQVEGGVTYTGSCHCGKVTLAVNTKPIDETYEMSVFVCNCSICERVSPLPFTYSPPCPLKITGTMSLSDTNTPARRRLDLPAPQPGRPRRRPAGHRRAQVQQQHALQDLLPDLRRAHDERGPRARQPVPRRPR